MTADVYPAGEDGQDRSVTLEAIDRDLERLGELTQAFVTDPREDLGVAVARMPTDDSSREAAELLGRLRSVMDSRLGESALGEQDPG